jgi:hypothetical protein
MEALARIDVSDLIGMGSVDFMHCMHPVVKSFWDEKADATGAETWFARLVTR